MSATTCPAAALEFVWTWQPPEPEQLPEEVEPPSGGPRAPFAPATFIGPSLPAAVLDAVPVHLVPCAQSIVAFAIDHADAPATVGPPAFADEPGAVGAGGVAGRSSFLPCSSDGCCDSPVVSCETVALAVDFACTTGAITFASGPVEAPEFVTA
ncbi:hypothetical protein [Pseudonocardia sp. TRM90224]|uniref:hypothetical protein n=1 Tax=Pseudonocardia sp. TRM90224 TaxID=2812678 RepID=UPI001E407222|nr:hypothetical protein [Pseudonocardia sp. TRM90224]